MVAAMPASAPGADGLPYAFWANAPSEIQDLLEDIAHEATLGRPLPPVLLGFNTIWIPKGEYAEESD